MPRIEKVKPKAPDGQQQPAGITCKSCGCSHFEVERTKKGNGCIVRVRRCRYCKRRLVTREVV